MAQQLPEPSEGDTIILNKDAAKAEHSVKRAVLLSSLLPGSGQAYNRKFWKMPLVYAALGTTIYFAIDNHREYRYYSDGFEALIKGDDWFNGQFSENNLIVIQNEFRKDRDLMIILAVLAYALNILDAYVDAHLFSYDMSENLSMRFEPWQQQTPYSIVSQGFSIQWNIDKKKKPNYKIY